MSFNIINPSGQCLNCKKVVEPHMKYCTLRCRDRAYKLRKKARENLGEAGKTYESERLRQMVLPPYPDSEWETLEAVASGLQLGESARFEQAKLAKEIPEGCKWQVDGDIGTLTKTGA